MSSKEKYQREYRRRTERNPDYWKKRYQKRKKVDPNLGKKAYRRQLILHPDYHKKHDKRRLELHPEYYKRKWERVLKRRERLCILLEGQIKCHNCDVTDMRLLHIDHIDGNGIIDRKRFKWNNNYKYYLSHPQEAKQSLQLLCLNCHRKKTLENKEHLPKVIRDKERVFLVPLLQVRRNRI